MEQVFQQNRSRLVGEPDEWCSEFGDPLLCPGPSCVRIHNLQYTPIFDLCRIPITGESVSLLDHPRLHSGTPRRGVDKGMDRRSALSDLLDWTIGVRCLRSAILGRSFKICSIVTHSICRFPEGSQEPV